MAVRDIHSILIACAFADYPDPNGELCLRRPFCVPLTALGSGEQTITSVRTARGPGVLRLRLTDPQIPAFCLREHAPRHRLSS